MRRLIGKFIPILALATVLTYPALYIISQMIRWSYTLHSALLYALICLALVFVALLFSEDHAGAGRAAALLVFPGSCVCGFCLHIGCESAWVSHCVLALVIVSIVLFVKTKMTWKIKLPLGVLSLLPLVPTLLMCLFGFFPIGKTTKLSCLSPDGAYMAKLSVADEGALGGGTVIRVYPMATVKRGILGEWVQEQEIYRGPWMDEDVLSFSWKDEQTLLLNEDAIQIP